jgi:hypothetical protein
MCLGDARLSSKVTWSQRLHTFALANEWEQILPQDRNRVGVIFGMISANDWYVWPGLDTLDDSNRGIHLDTVERFCPNFMWTTHGRLTTMAWQGRVATAVNTVNILVATVPGEVMTELEQMDIK